MQNKDRNIIAAVLTFFLPGLGHLLQRRFLRAILVFLICIALYVTWYLLVTGLLAFCIHLWAIYDVALFKKASI
jgi:TM2 domain-containing membrane protein YozV